MPWKECNPVDERLRFVVRLLDGEKMAAVCRDFGISRKTGYKIFNRYKGFGLRGLEDRARSPYRHPNKLLYLHRKQECLSEHCSIRYKENLSPYQNKDDPSP